jgi:hypothetical protein
MQDKPAENPKMLAGRVIALDTAYRAIWLATVAVSCGLGLTGEPPYPPWGLPALLIVAFVLQALLMWSTFRIVKDIKAMKGSNQ